MSLKSNALLQTIAHATTDSAKDTRLATVNSVSGDNTYVIYYGETEPSMKPLKKLASVGTLTKGQIVFIARVNNSYIITGRVQ